MIEGLLSTGSTYSIKVRAHNHAGYTDSPPIVVVLAAVPDTPSSAPTSDALVTDQEQIKVSYGPLLASENGGSDILSYEIQMDDGQGGDFYSLAGGETAGDSLATTYTIGQDIQDGGLYRFRYRARNVNGWSSFSAIAYVRAATVPTRPSSPRIYLIDITSITVTVQKALDDGGSYVSGYQLWRN